MFICRECQHTTAKWMGQCPQCHEWNTFIEQESPLAKNRKIASGKPAVPVELHPAEMPHIERTLSPSGELNGVL